ncbi:MAG: tRNA (N(6)-L-threonylcarbamoyladenosine(37)-C(2))-methylthiotransferase MtaB [Bacteroidota bacterium]|nr:tRNA (N(6)-L-threonylcarbamoyladenosine(37)-C(2))-methylthiotransferase MtaB [Bacteroidota bacterium]MDE2957955.1 tRNA (N(6)-L-threonylcarbamoyladenosine(37)-C(2))-methylthiotransferase MtaB [Bacteroidota bacterium]
MPRVSFHTLGCKLNMAESSHIRRTFEARAFTVVPFGDTAEVSVVNTCSVTAEADRKCRQVIRRMRRASPEGCIIVTGCYAQLRPDEVAAIDGVDFVLGNKEKAQLFNVIDRFTRRDKTQVSVSCIGSHDTFDAALLAGDRTRAFLKIQDGCDYSCAFCTIPLARGKSRSARPDDVLAQAHTLARRGIREIVLTGVNVGLYGNGSKDPAGGLNLLMLLRRLAAVEGIRRYRISSIEPNLLTDEIIEFVAETPSFVPHFHIPLQSGDNYVLGRMRRRYRREVYADRLRQIRKCMPDAGIGADVIVGFPAETPERFNATRRFLADQPVTYIHAFTYSERPDTAAVSNGETPVPKQERRRRTRVIRALSARKERAFTLEHTDTVRPVLWEHAQRGGLMGGYTDNYIRVQRPLNADLAGRIEQVRLGSQDAALMC